MEELTLTTPALLFSAVSLILLAYTNRFLSYAQLVRQLRDRYVENPSDITEAQIENLRKRLNLTRTRTGYCKSFSLRSQYVSYLYRTAIIFCLRIRTGTDSVDSLSRRIFPRNTDFHPFIGDLLGNDGEREKQKITRLTIPPIKFYQDTTRQGRMTVKRLPLPTSDLSSILPPSFSIIT